MPSAPTQHRYRPIKKANHAPASPFLCPCTESGDGILILFFSFFSLACGGGGWGLHWPSFIMLEVTITLITSLSYTVNCRPASGLLTHSAQANTGLENTKANHSSDASWKFTCYSKNGIQCLIGCSEVLHRIKKGNLQSHVAKVKPARFKWDFFSQLHLSYRLHLR